MIKILNKDFTKKNVPTKKHLYGRSLVGDWSVGSIWSTRPKFFQSNVSLGIKESALKGSDGIVFAEPKIYIYAQSYIILSNAAVIEKVDGPEAYFYAQSHIDLSVAAMITKI